MDSHFQEFAAQITKDVTERVSAAVNAHVSNVVTAAEERLAEQARADAKAFKATVKATVQAAEKRLAKQAQLNVEAVREEARLAAEGYAVTVDAINSRLDRMEAKMDARFENDDAVLKNHNQRITTLENKSA